MAISTAITTLAYETGTPGTYAKLIDIVTHPDMGSAPSKLDTTTLSDAIMKTFILGLQESPDLTFECNFTKTGYTTLKAMEGVVKNFHLSLGTTSGLGLTGADGTFSWSGQISTMLNGGGVDEVRKLSHLHCPNKIEELHHLVTDFLVGFLVLTTGSTALTSFSTTFFSCGKI